MTCSRSTYSHPLLLVTVFWLLVPLLALAVLISLAVDMVLLPVNRSIKRLWLKVSSEAWNRLKPSPARMPRSRNTILSGGHVTSPSYKPSRRR